MNHARTPTLIVLCLIAASASLAGTILSTSAGGLWSPGATSCAS